MTPQEQNTSRVTQDAVWGAADKYLRNVVEPEEYGDYILPFVVLRRLECLLDETKPQVLEFLPTTNFTGENLDRVIKAKFGLSFYNSSTFDLPTIAATDDHVLESLSAYLDGFSESVNDIWDAFEFEAKAATLQKANRLWGVVKHFATMDMHPDSLTDTAMGDLFEDIMYRAFNTKGKGAGAFYTPRDAIRLMVDVLFCSDDDGLSGPAPTRSIYDPTAGTGGMLLVAARALQDLNPNIDVGLYGQELMDSAYAIGKADLLIQGGRPDSIRQGNTLTDDLFPGETFDYVLSNPPYGSDWSADYDEVLKEAGTPGSRFSHGLPPRSDGQMLFLSHVVSKLAPRGEGGKGGRAGVVMNGSPLFTGGPGSGPDQIRAWLLNEDLVDAIIALPTNMFYGTGISTYIWILDTHKEERREGRVQLIDASAQWTSMRKGMGDKRREMTEADREVVLRAYSAFEDSEISKIVTADDLGYRDVPVYRPRHLTTSVTEKTVNTALIHSAATEAHRPVIEAMAGVAWNALPTALKAAAKKAGVKMPIGLLDAITTALGVDDPEAPVAVDRKGKPVVADGGKMVERIPLSEDVTEHMESDVLPFAPDAMWDEDAAKEGYEIPFTRLFYKPASVRPLEEIDADIAGLMTQLGKKFQEVRA
jgi:type I restriction enzyme M protein